MTTAPPAPRRTRDGRIIVGPSLGARYRPGATMGLPLVSALLSPVGAAGLSQIRGRMIRDADGYRPAGWRGTVVDLLGNTAIQLLAGALLLWALLALWAFVLMALTHTSVTLAEQTRLLHRRRGPFRSPETRAIRDLIAAEGTADRHDVAILSFTAEEAWMVEDIGWDRASFDGLRALQAAAGLTVAPPATVLRQISRHRRLAVIHREMAAQVGMPWRDEYDDDPEAFSAEFDHVRRVLGGLESPRIEEPGEGPAAPAEQERR
ncbi:MAG: hypothetical protein Q4G40_09445 [Brachybacterium sp.]|nr:hypothetical protein [Brachybacterium sp.]